MKNSQLIELLRSLNKTEFREFGKFINSPYFNNRSEVIRFYDVIKKFYPLFDSNGLNEEKIFNSVYPGKVFSDVMMRKLVSLMTNLILDFYAEISFKDDILGYNVKLLYKLYEKNLSVMFEKKAKSIEELLQNSKHTFEYYEAKFNFTSKVNGYLCVKKESATVPKYQKELDDFIEYFLSVVLVLYQRMETISNIHDIKYDRKLYSEVIEFLNKNDYRDVTLVSMYYNLVMLANTQEEKYFNELKKFSDISSDKLTHIFQYNIYVSMYDYCFNRINKGDLHYKKELFKLTKKYFSKNIFPKECGYIQSLLFSGVIGIAAYFKEFKWIEEFINNYKQRLDPETAIEAINYSFAKIEFEKGSYEKSLKHLSKINPEQLSMKLNAKNLLIMLHYELNYTEELISLIDTYKHFLHRDKNANERLKQRDANFIKFILALVKIKTGEKNASASKLKKEIESTPYFGLKDWLLKKAEELIK